MEAELFWEEAMLPPRLLFSKPKQDGKIPAQNVLSGVQGTINPAPACAQQSPAQIAAFQVAIVLLCNAQSRLAHWLCHRRSWHTIKVWTTETPATLPGVTACSAAPRLMLSASHAHAHQGGATNTLLRFGISCKCFCVDTGCLKHQTCLFP